MSKKFQFELAGVHRQILGESGGVSIRLRTDRDSLVRLLNSNIPDAQKVHQELEAEIASALAEQTAASREVAARRQEITATQERVAALQTRRETIPAEISRAVAAHDLETADKLDGERAGLPAALAALEKRLQLLESLLDDAEKVLESERRQKASAIRQRKEAEHQGQIDAAYKRFAETLTKTAQQPLAEIWALEALHGACREGWQPHGVSYPLTPEESRAIEERNAALREEQNRVRGEAERKAREEHEKRQEQKYRAEQVAADSPGLVAWARGLGKWPW